MTWRNARGSGRPERERRGRRHDRTVYVLRNGRRKAIPTNGSWADLLDDMSLTGTSFGVEVEWHPDPVEQKRRREALVGTINKSAQRRLFTLTTRIDGDYIWFTAQR